MHNGRLSARVNFNMPDICQTIPDSLTITIKRNVRFRGRICSKKFQLDQIQMADDGLYLILMCLISVKPCKIARQFITKNKMCSFIEGYALKNVNSIKFKMAILSLICVISGKPYHKAGPLLLNKMCSFKE